MFSNEDYVDMHFIYGFCGGNEYQAAEENHHAKFERNFEHRTKQGTIIFFITSYNIL